MEEKRIPKYVTETELAGILKISKQKLSLDRMKGRGLPFEKVGRCVRYDLGDVLATVKATRKDPEKEFQEE